MPKSLRARLDGNIQEFIDGVKTYGIWSQMEKFGFKDYLAVRRLLTEETGDENFGIRPDLNHYNNQGIKGVFQELVASFADHIIKIERENALMKRQLEAHQKFYKKDEIKLAEHLVNLTESLRE